MIQTTNKKKVNGNTKSNTIKRRKSRVTFSLKKIKKTVSLSWLNWDNIDKFAKQQNTNRSHIVEMAVWSFFSDKLNQDLMDLEMAKEKVAMLDQRVKNKLDRKKLAQELTKRENE